MKVLVACEESQAVCKEFRYLGYEAYSCDLFECRGGHPEWHIRHDVLPYLNGNCTFVTMDGVQHSIVGKWDLIIAFPPCTYLSCAGAGSLYPKGILNEERYQKGLEARAFFQEFLDADCEHIAVENPKDFKIFNLPPYTQVIQPYQFGHPYSKHIRLWLKNLPKLVPTKVLEHYETTSSMKCWFYKGGKDRQKNRAVTFPGIARAMAEQWSKYIEDEYR